MMDNVDSLVKHAYVDMYSGIMVHGIEVIGDFVDICPAMPDDEIKDGIGRFSRSLTKAVSEETGVEMYCMGCVYSYSDSTPVFVRYDVFEDDRLVASVKPHPSRENFYTVSNCAPLIRLNGYDEPSAAKWSLREESVFFRGLVNLALRRERHYGKKVAFRDYDAEDALERHMETLSRHWTKKAALFLLSFLDL